MDLNDLRYFALVVEHGGFSAAERHAHISKSKLSRRIALMEGRVGLRLLQRSTRKLALTEAGRVFYEHCAAMVVEADAAAEALEGLRSEPSGTVRMTCPSGLAQSDVTRLLADFMRRYPKVRVEFDSSDRIVDLVEERIDVALRARDVGPIDSGLVARRIAASRLVLVASPDYLEGSTTIDGPDALVDHDTIGAMAEGAEQHWSLVCGDGRTARVRLRPRLLCSDFMVQYQAALGGVGVALLPLRVAWPGLGAGSLRQVAKDWGTSGQGIFLIFATRRGMLPAVRALIDHLVKHMPVTLAE
jgi:DNA-binding transcriptional LysR family regulator